MTGSKEDSIYLEHILESIKWIEEYLLKVTYDSFIDNHLIQDGVIRQIEIIGEVSKRISKALTDSNELVPWKDIIGMRNKLIHDYLGVDVDAVWETAVNDIPNLKREISKMLKSLSK